MLENQDFSRSRAAACKLTWVFQFSDKRKKKKDVNENSFNGNSAVLKYFICEHREKERSRKMKGRDRLTLGRMEI